MWPVISSSADPFQCPHCSLNNQAAEIDILKKAVMDLTQRISDLEKHLHQADPNQSVRSISDPPDRSLSGQSSPTQSSVEGVAPRRVGKVPYKSQSPQSPLKSGVVDYNNRQLNVVVHGIPECNKGQLRKQKWVSDLKNVSNLFNESSAAVPKSAIRDCRRLGKFSDSSSRPRPILVRFNSCNVVMDLLQKRSLFSPYVIKSDLPADARLREKMLLKERWNLIQSGTNKSDIKIKGNTLLVNSLPFGRVDQSGNFAVLGHSPSPPPPPRSRSVSPRPTSHNFKTILRFCIQQQFHPTC